MPDSFELRVSADGQSASLVRVGSVGELSGSVGELAQALRCDGYALRARIASGEIPALFEGSGRYTIDGVTVARGVDQAARPLPVERDVDVREPVHAPSPSLVDAVRELPYVAGDAAGEAQELARRAETGQWHPMPPLPFDRGRFLF